MTTRAARTTTSRLAAGARKVRRAPVAALVVGSALMSVFAPARAQGLAPPELDQPFAQEALARGRFARLVADLDRVSADAFLDAAQELVARSGPAALSAVVLVAGREVPAGLSTARETERRAHREAARAYLLADLARTEALLAELLKRPSPRGAPGASSDAPSEVAPATPAGAEAPPAEPLPTQPQPVHAPPIVAGLRAAAANVVGALGLFELAPKVAGLLDLSAEPGTVVAARSALHALHGRWYPGRAAFHSRCGRASRARAPARLFLDEAR
ncbi:MAG: hypothetical protein R3F49_18935 [Planctomycetota bacterium]